MLYLSTALLKGVEQYLMVVIVTLNEFSDNKHSSFTPILSTLRFMWPNKLGSIKSGWDIIAFSSKSKNSISSY